MIWQDTWSFFHQTMGVEGLGEKNTHSQVATACPRCATALWTWSFTYHGSHFQAQLVEFVGESHPQRWIFGEWGWVFRATCHSDLVLQPERKHVAIMIHEINSPFFPKPGLIYNLCFEMLSYFPVSTAFEDEMMFLRWWFGPSWLHHLLCFFGAPEKQACQRLEGSRSLPGGGSLVVRAQWTWWILDDVMWT